MKAILSIDPVKFPLTGIGRYTYELANGLSAAGLEDLQFLRGYRLQRALPTVPQADPMARQPAWKRWAQKNPVAVEIYRTINPLLKARALRGMPDHIFHGPNYYLPPFDGPSIVTIHDLSAYLWSESHPPERVRYMRAEIELSLKRASAIITDTAYTRDEVARFSGWPLEKIYPVHLACSDDFHPRTAEEAAPILREFNLTYRHYAFALGTIEPRKNIETLIDAYQGLPRSLRQHYPLVLAGYTGWENASLHRKIEKAQEEGWLRYLGFVAGEALPSLLAGARVFAFPSFYEGFGLPVLEAMASGVPVIASNASTLPEVAADAALFHAPHDCDGLRNALEQALEDEAWRSNAVQRGLARAAHFSWQRCTQETLAAYRSIV